MTTDPTINRLRALAEKATPGPWHLSLDYTILKADLNDNTGDVIIRAVGNSWEKREANARFIFTAANPQAILALLDRLEAAERVVEALRVPLVAHYQHREAERLLADYDRVCGGEKS